MGPRNSYLCLIPPPPVDNASIPTDEPTTEVTPVHTWSLLQPLTGSCLYVWSNNHSEKTCTDNSVRAQHRQGWFTYAYCHNSHVRQFHELQHPPSHKPGEPRF